MWGFMAIAVLIPPYDVIMPANQSGFISTVENNITNNTLPTYRYLRKIGIQQKQLHFTALIETLTIELLSRLHLLDYSILAYQRPKH